MKNSKTQNKLNIKKFQIAKIQNLRAITGGNNGEPIKTKPTIRARQ